MTRFVPTARCAVMPTAARSAGIRSVPRMTPTAPPSTPTPKPDATAAPILGRSRGRARNGLTSRSVPFQSRIAAMSAYSRRSGAESPKSAPTTAPTTVGGIIHAATRQSTLPSRACCTLPDPAEAALMATLVPAAEAASPESKRMSGRRSVPSTSPTAAPSAPATNEPAKATASSQVTRGVRAGRPTETGPGRSRRRSGARLPERLVAVLGHVRTAGEDEEEVGQSVQVDQDQRIDVDLPGGGEGIALGAAAGRARDVQPGRGLGAAGKDEALELGEVGVEAVAVALEVRDLLVGDSQAPVTDAVRDGEVGADVEELVLHAFERSPEVVGDLSRHRMPDVRVQFVDGAEGADAAIELGDTTTVAEARLATVASARVDACESNRLVAFARCHDL